MNGSGRYKMKSDMDGSFFIDRDGSVFHHILNYLRSPAQFQAPTDTRVCKAIWHEAEFYKIVRFSFRIYAFLQLLLSNTSFYFPFPPSPSSLSIFFVSYSCELFSTVYMRRTRTCGIPFFLVSLGHPDGLHTSFLLVEID